MSSPFSASTSGTKRPRSSLESSENSTATTTTLDVPSVGRLFTIDWSVLPQLRPPEVDKLLQLSCTVCELDVWMQTKTQIWGQQPLPEHAAMRTVEYLWHLSSTSSPPFDFKSLEINFDEAAELNASYGRKAVANLQRAIVERLQALQSDAWMEMKPLSDVCRELFGNSEGKEDAQDKETSQQQQQEDDDDEDDMQVEGEEKESSPVKPAAVAAVAPPVAQESSNIIGDEDSSSDDDEIKQQVGAETQGAANVLASMYDR